MITFMNLDTSAGGQTAFVLTRIGVLVQLLFVSVRRITAGWDLIPGQICNVSRVQKRHQRFDISVPLAGDEGDIRSIGEIRRRFFDRQQDRCILLADYIKNHARKISLGEGL